MAKKQKTEVATISEASVPATVMAKLDEFIGQASEAQTLAKFSKTGFFKGPEEDPIEPGTQFAVYPEGIRAGWKVWQDRSLVKEVMVTVLKDGAPPPRETVGFNDETEWELDDDGKPRDPAANVMEVPLKATDGSGEQLLFATSSQGGRQAVVKLLMAYRAGLAQGLAGYPVVEFQVGNYKHRQYGRINKPLLPVVCWRTESELVNGKADLDEVLDDSIADIF